MKNKINFFGVALLIILIFAEFSFVSCASRQKKIMEEKTESGIMGTIIPVNSKGEVLENQPRDKAIINCNYIGAKGNEVYTANPDSEGKFKILLKSGDYRIEIFLKGFKVKSFEINIAQGTMLNLGEIKLVRFETQMGKPILGEENQKPILNEGDVSIQPPSS